MVLDTHKICEFTEIQHLFLQKLLLLKIAGPEDYNHTDINPVYYLFQVLRVRKLSTGYIFLCSMDVFPLYPPLLFSTPFYNSPNLNDLMTLSYLPCICCGQLFNRGPSQATLDLKISSPSVWCQLTIFVWGWGPETVREGVGIDENDKNEYFWCWWEAQERRERERGGHLRVRGWSKKCLKISHTNFHTDCNSWGIYHNNTYVLYLMFEI